MSIDVSARIEHRVRYEGERLVVPDIYSTEQRPKTIRVYTVREIMELVDDEWYYAVRLYGAMQTKTGKDTGKDSNDRSGFSDYSSGWGAPLDEIPESVRLLLKGAEALQGILQRTVFEA